MASIEAISALTLATHDMARAVPFYEQLGFGDPDGHELSFATPLARVRGAPREIG